jgi:hypothetical protein
MKFSTLQEVFLKRKEKKKLGLLPQAPCFPLKNKKKKSKFTIN